MDENLGPLVMNCSDYIRCCLTEHLGNKTYYIYLPEEDARIKINQQESKLQDLYMEHRERLSKDHQKYFENTYKRVAEKGARLPQFYRTAKVHKKKKSVWPIISSVGSFPQIFSKYADWWLKIIVRKNLHVMIT